MASNTYLATMGLAILNLPYAMGSMTWVGGVVSGVIAYLISFYTLYLMLELHEHKGRRFNRYRELGELAFGTSALLPPSRILHSAQMCSAETSCTAICRSLDESPERKQAHHRVA